MLLKQLLMLHFVVSSCPFTEYVLCALSSGSKVGLPVAADGKFVGVLAFLSPNMCVLHCVDVQDILRVHSFRWVCNTGQHLMLL